jgi:uncharacterized membrane protein YeaQ/YmgE (transglycosylase-associated protein family)
MLGVALEIDIMNIGSLHIVTATVGAFVALMVARFLTAGRTGRGGSR